MTTYPYSKLLTCVLFVVSFPSFEENGDSHKHKYAQNNRQSCIEGKFSTSADRIFSVAAGGQCQCLRFC